MLSTAISHVKTETNASLLSISRSVPSRFSETTNKFNECNCSVEIGASNYFAHGEVVLYRRSNSPVWQSRYKLQDGSWYRASTRKMSVENAFKVACTMYDEARFRQSISANSRTFCLFGSVFCSNSHL